MRRSLFAIAGLLVSVSMVQAQTTVPTYIVAPGGTVNVTVTGSPGQNFAVIASTTNSGFSYGGVPLAVGADVEILALGVLGGTGQAIVPVTPPFPERDRYYVQGVLSASPDFLPPSPLNSVTLVNADPADLSARAAEPFGMTESIALLQDSAAHLRGVLTRLAA